jgi:Bacterial regulatory proteins, tetR family
MSTASDPARHRPEIRAFPTQRRDRTQAAIDAAARTVIARKGILATTIADIAAEAGRSPASFCYIQLGGARAKTGEPDDQACIQPLANIYYRAIYFQGGLN